MTQFRPYTGPCQSPVLHLALRSVQNIIECLFCLIRTVLRDSYPNPRNGPTNGLAKARPATVVKSRAARSRVNISHSKSTRVCPRARVPPVRSAHIGLPSGRRRSFRIGRQKSARPFRTHVTGKCPLTKHSTQVLVAQVAERCLRDVLSAFLSALLNNCACLLRVPHNSGGGRNCRRKKRSTK